MKKLLFAAFSAAFLQSQADLLPRTPCEAETVPVQTECELAVSAIPDFAGRAAWLEKNAAEVKKDADSKWRTAPPLRFSWVATANEHGPWKLEVSRRPDFSEPVIREFCKHSEKSSKTSEGTLKSLTVQAPNLEVGRDYFWRISQCKGARAVSAPARFSTADTPPRWIKIEGNTKNIRDIGGWKTCDGFRVRQGLAFRGQGFNDNSANGAVPGRNRLYVADVEYLTRTLGIKTDLDLRSGRETADMTESPLGPGVKFIHHSSEHYSRIFNADGKAMMARNFRVFCDWTNYPIYFHCIAGADRTGALAYVLEGVLGVDKHDLDVDWEHTFYPAVHGVSPKDWRNETFISDGFDAYGGKDTPLKTKIERYLLDCGITAEEIETFRSIMLEKPEKCRSIMLEKPEK